MKRLSQAVGAMLLALSVGSSAAAQELGLGVKGGFIRSTLGGKDATDVKARNDFGAGAFLTVNLAPGFGLQPELLYARKGVRASAVEEGMAIDAAMHVDYVEVPLLARISAPRGAVRPHLLVGPAVGFRSRCGVKGEALGISVSVDCADMGLRKTDFLLAGGVGADIALGPGSLVLEARYDHSLTSIDSGPDASKSYNRSYMAFAGFSIPVGGPGAVALGVH